METTMFKDDELIEKLEQDLAASYKQLRLNDLSVDDILNYLRLAEDEIEKV